LAAVDLKTAVSASRHWGRLYGDMANLGYAQPKIFNIDQGVRFTSATLTGNLQASGIEISMDSQVHFLENIFLERL